MNFRCLILLIVVSFSWIKNTSAQDTTLVGRFSVGVVGSYFKTNIAEEVYKGGAGFQMRYFPSQGFAFSISYNRLQSSILRFNQISKAYNSSIGFGVEKHVPLGSFSPYLGLEAGLNFTRVNSNLVKLPSNITYFQNNLPNYLFKPKIGCIYYINDNLFAHVEGAFNWVISADRANSNPLFDDSYTAIYFGRKIPTFSIGIHYLFRE
jgi:hypothetical protein